MIEEGIKTAIKAVAIVALIGALVILGITVQIPAYDFTALAQPIGKVMSITAYWLPGIVALTAFIIARYTMIIGIKGWHLAKAAYSWVRSMFS